MQSVQNSQDTFRYLDIFTYLDPMVLG